MSRIVALAVLLVLLCSSFSGVAADRGYRSGGWHFYRDPPPPTKPPPTAPPTAEAAEPAPLSTAWLRENLPRYLERAIDDPTPRNLELYGLLQRMTLDKADRFSSAMQHAIATNPLLDESARNPVSTFARNALSERMNAARSSALSIIARKSGIWFFFRSDCPFCHRQAPLLDSLTQRIGMAVLPISLDGAPLHSGDYPSYVTNDGHAEQLGVTSVPALYLFQPPRKLTPISLGIRTQPEIEQRLLELGVAEGLITQSQFDDAVRGMPVQYLTDANLSRAQLAAAANDPDALLALLRSASVSGGSSSATPLRSPVGALQ